MGFKEIASLDADVTISLGGTSRKTGKKNPTRVEGYYLGARVVADQKKKSGKSFIYFFQTPKGNVGVWGKTDMDRKMGAVTPGTMTFVEFDKMVPTPNGDMYKYKVGVDKENTIEVDTLPVGAAPVEAEGFTSDSEGTFGTEVTDEVATDDDDALQAEAAELLAQERRAKVQALLNRNTKTK